VGRGGRNAGPRLGGLRNPPVMAGGPRSDEGAIKLEVGGGMQTWCFTSVDLSGRVGLIDRRHGLKPDWGELNVRNFRGGAGNVRDGRTRNPRHLSKEWRVETLDLRLRAPVLYSTSLSMLKILQP
jgi:hypothetical protein